MPAFPAVTPVLNCSFSSSPVLGLFLLGFSQLARTMGLLFFFFFDSELLTFIWALFFLWSSQAGQLGGRLGRVGTVWSWGDGL